MEQHVDTAAQAAHVVDRCGDGIGVGEVDRVVVHGPTGGLDGLDGGECGVEALEPCELALDGHRRRVVTGRLHPLGDRDLQAVAVATERLEVGVGGVGRRGQVEQVERATRGGSEIGGDRRHDAARRAGDHDDRVVIERHARTGDRLAVVGPLRERRLDERHAEAPVVDPPDLDTARIEERLLDQLPGDR